MIDRRTFARLAAGLVLGLAGLAHAALEPCEKNHYILDQPCAVEWTAVNKGLADLDVHVVAVDPARPSTLYAGGPSGIFKSLDGGGVWNKAGFINLDDTALALLITRVQRSFTALSLVSRIAIDPRRPATLYAATSSANGNCAGFQDRLYKSTDSGGSWTVMGPTPRLGGCDAIRAMVIATPEPRALYLANGWAGDAHSPAIKTADAGASWSNLSYLELDAFAPHPTDAAIVYAGTSEYPNEYSPLPTGVLESRDGGATWSATGLTGIGITRLAVDPGRPRTLYAAAGLSGRTPKSGGLFKSTDGGTKWTAINEGLAHLFHLAYGVSALVVDAIDSNLVYLAMAGGGVWRSIDAGATWSPFNDGLPTLNIRSLSVVAGTPRALYAGTPSGVFRVFDIAPVLTVEAPKRCVGAPWTVKLARGKPDAFARLYGSFTDHPGVANRRNDPWEGGGFITDARGGFSTSGIFTEAGIHTLRVEVGDALSNSVSVEVHICPP